jgi:sRNA-binding carbon storage regulator CsrA
VLKLSRDHGQTIVIGRGPSRVVVHLISNGRAVLGIDAPADVPILRGELADDPPEPSPQPTLEQVMTALRLLYPDAPAEPVALLSAHTRRHILLFAVREVFGIGPRVNFPAGLYQIVREIK